jgi:hypothetical protein
MKATNLERYGNVVPINSKELQEKLQEKNLKLYGTKHGILRPETQEKIKESTIKTCTVDIITKTIAQCAGGSGTCTKLNQNSVTGAFSYTSGANWSTSNFKREIQISPVSSTEVEIIVTMSWNTGGLSKTFQIKESLFNGQ